MYRLAVAALSLLSAVSAAAQSSPVSDPLAVTLAQQSVAALSRGATVTDVTLKANAISVLGSDGETGTAMLMAKGIGESRVDLTLNSWTRSDIRNIANGVPAGEWMKNGSSPSSYALHNSWTDAVWFFPALSSLTQTANPNFTFTYVGQEQHSGVNVQHIAVCQIWPSDTNNQFNAAHLSTMDFYLDPTSSLPVAAAFKVYPDTDMNTDIPVEVRFGNYQVVSGIRIPFHVQRMLNGNVVLDLTVTSAVVNSGLADAPFSLQ